jgi:hypothetical protein
MIVQNFKYHHLSFSIMNSIEKSSSTVVKFMTLTWGAYPVQSVIMVRACNQLFQIIQYRSNGRERLVSTHNLIDERQGV